LSIIEARVNEATYEKEWAKNKDNKDDNDEFDYNQVADTDEAKR